jgi:hypothetical protein
MQNLSQLAAVGLVQQSIDANSPPKAQHKANAGGEYSSMRPLAVMQTQILTSNNFFLNL